MINSVKSVFLIKSIWKHTNSKMRQGIEVGKLLIFVVNIIT